MSLSVEYVINPIRASVLCLGTIKFDRNPYSGFDVNTTDLRAEASVLFVVRKAGAMLELPASGS